MLTIGVVAIQGAVSEHITALEKSSKDLDWQDSDHKAGRRSPTV